MPAPAPAVAPVPVAEAAPAPASASEPGTRVELEEILDELESLRDLLRSSHD